MAGYRGIRPMVSLLRHSHAPVAGAAFCMRNCQYLDAALSFAEDDAVRKAIQEGPAGLADNARKLLWRLPDTLGRPTYIVEKMCGGALAPYEIPFESRSQFRFRSFM